MLLPLLVVNRQEMVFASIMFICVLVAMELSNDIASFSGSEFKREVVNLAKNPYIYALSLVIVITQLFLWTDWIWTIAPSIFRNAQFPFRWWSIFSFVAVFLLIYLLKPFKGKRVAAEIFLTISVGLYVFSMGPVDKRIADSNGAGLVAEPTFSKIENLSKVGVMNEYMPQVFYESGYESQYSNSLYSYVKDVVRNTHDWDFTLEDYHTPVFLEGAGVAEVTNLNSPELDISLTVTEKGLVQLPQFYYDGYIVTFTSEEGNSHSVEPIYVDGLLAFEVNEGTYKAEVRYIGSVSYRVTVPFFFVSVVALIATPIAYTIVKNSKKKKASIAAS